MFSIEYDDIELAWDNEPPSVHRSTIERTIRAEIRLINQNDFRGRFVLVDCAECAVVYVYDNSPFHCIYLG
jgi:hypothetical protein